MTAHPSTAQPTTDEALRRAARCPICRAHKYHGDAFCDEHLAHLALCGACGQTARVLEGLCGDCQVRDTAVLDLDVDQPIPFTLTEKAYTALGVAVAS